VNHEVNSDDALDSQESFMLLREKTVEVEILEREEHLSLPVIDSIDEMSELLRSDKKVWVNGIVSQPSFSSSPICRAKFTEIITGKS
jgi:hypothetical protein